MRYVFFVKVLIVNIKCDFRKNCVRALENLARKHKGLDGCFGSEASECGKKAAQGLKFSVPTHRDLVTFSKKSNERM